MTALWVFTIAFWATVVLTGLSLVAMIVELRLHSVPVKFPPITLNAARRIRKSVEIITTYRRFKKERGAVPLFIWTMWIFGAGIVVVPLVALVYYLAWGF